jgi:hypothetical protein
MAQHNYSWGTEEWHHKRLPPAFFDWRTPHIFQSLTTVRSDVAKPWILEAVQTSEFRPWVKYWKAIVSHPPHILKHMHCHGWYFPIRWCQTWEKSRNDSRREPTATRCLCFWLVQKQRFWQLKTIQERKETGLDPLSLVANPCNAIMKTCLPNQLTCLDQTRAKYKLGVQRLKIGEFNVWDHGWAVWNVKMLILIWY